MRCFLIAFTALLLFATNAAQAKISIIVDKNNQLMTVSVDGVQRYQWPVSTGNPSHETPNGSFKTFRMEADHYSKEFDDAPMPHSIFFTKAGHAIHGTVSEGRLGTPASHGCVRLSRANAATLYAMVQKDGVLNTSVTLTGSSQIALARNPRTRPTTAIARRDPAEVPAPQYDAAGDPVQLAPQGMLVPRPAPQPRPDDGYIYPAQGSEMDIARYPSPTRRIYDAQAYPQPQQQPYYGNRGYAPPQYPAPQYPSPQVYQPRSIY